MGIQLNPNFASQINAINNAVPSAMNRTFYVDAVNGDDTNDGSSSAPFKTLTKAINSVPTGGWGQIYLKSDIIYDGVENLLVNKDRVTLIIINDPSLTSNPKIIFNNNKSRLIAGNNITLWFNNIDFDFNFTGLTSGVPLFLWGTHVYAGDGGLTTGGGLGFYGCNININIDTDVSVWISFFQPFVRFYNTIINYNNTTGNDFLRIVDGINCAKLIFTGTWAINVNGVALTLSDISSHITNLVKDANGVPRNILSNIIL